MATAAYQPEPEAAAAARRFVRDTLAAWPLAGTAAAHAELVDDAVLLTSELVTNAVVHAGTPVQVTCRLADTVVEVVVLDRHPVQLVPDRVQGEQVPAERTSGRGLLLPAELASSWGVTYARTAKAVWFRLGITGPGLAETPSAGPSAAPSPQPPPAWPQASPPPPAESPPPQPPVTAQPDAVLPVLASRDLGRLGYEELLSHTVEAARALMAADAAYLLCAGEDGELRMRAAAGAGQSTAADLAQFATGPAPAAAGPARALAEAARSLVTVPLVVGGLVTGVLAVAAAEPGQFSDQDTARLQELADRAAPALEQARLGEIDRARSARAAFLSAASEMLSGQDSQAQIVAMTAQLVVPQLADWCALLLPSAGGGLCPAYLVHADESRADALAWLLERVRPGAVWPTAGHRWRLATDGAAGLRADGAPPPAAAQLADDGAWCFPLTVDGQDLGLLAVGGVTGSRLPSEAAELAAALARRAALALDNSRRQARHRLPSRAPLSPPSLPEPPRIPGVELAAAHEQPGDAAGPGGGFHDFFP
ncbi:MAG: GAF domain-containing protein, partial [Actinomycetota bacterium]